MGAEDILKSWDSRLKDLVPPGTLLSPSEQEFLKLFAEEIWRVEEKLNNEYRTHWLRSRIDKLEEEMGRFRKEYHSNRDNDLENIQHFVGSRFSEQDRRIAAFVRSDALTPDGKEIGVRCPNHQEGLHRLEERKGVGLECTRCGRVFLSPLFGHVTLDDLKRMGVLP